MNVGILGGGLAGVALRSFLRLDSEILEKESRLGGLCRTFETNGFLYDIGGHILFSENQKLINAIIDVVGNNINYRRRNNKILYKGRYVKYPFENGLSSLDKEEILECLIGYLQNSHTEPKNLMEWFYFTFGDGLADKYLIPYNRKIWKTPLKEMSLEWVKRIPRPPMEDVIKSALGIETEGYLHQLHFYYPSNGGIESLIKGFLGKPANSETNYQVRQIRKRRDSWVVSNGSAEKIYDKLVLTFPLKEAIKCLEAVPLKVSNAVAGLKHNSVRVVLVGINNESLMDKSAIYIPSQDVLAHRVCFMGYFSKNNVPPGTSSLVAEITTNPGYEYHKISDSALTDRVVSDLQGIGIIRRNDIIVTGVTNAEYAYVVYDQNYHANIKIIRDYFESLGIELLGRFAEFEYINMDEVIRRASALAAKLDSVYVEN